MNNIDLCLCMDGLSNISSPNRLLGKKTIPEGMRLDVLIANKRSITKLKLEDGLLWAW